MSVASLPNAAPQTNVAQTNTFNITGADPNAVAAQVENVLKKQNQQAFGALARVQADK
ncbi:MAG: hypothetical protein JST00_46790 [Deltaproteobacteria bacterium]|nr:hypothetical protein [Deltaproteobacteria bacterium]